MINEKIEHAIEVMADKITAAVQPDQALKFTQAALNLAHVKGVLTAQERDRRAMGAKQTKGASAS